MRQPTFTRRRRLSRQKRLLRTGIVLVLLVVLISAIVSLFGGSKPKLPLAHVAFQTVASSQSDAKHKASPVKLDAERARITSMLNGFYQQAYVDPSKFGDGTFGDVAKLFDPTARASFQKDVDSLSIGDLRTETDRVVPLKQTGTITVFFTNGKTPKLAVAVVTFVARVTLKDDSQLPVTITQHATYHLEKNGGSWMITYYTTEQSEHSTSPAPSGSASS